MLPEKVANGSLMPGTMAAAAVTLAGVAVWVSRFPKTRYLGSI